MDYFAILQAPPFELGYAGDILARSFQRSFNNEALGYEPWYAGANNYDRPIRPFPEGLILTRKQLVPNHRSIRSGSRYFYIIDDIFESSIRKLKTNFAQAITIQSIDPAGELLDEGLFAARTTRVPARFFHGVTGTRFHEDDKSIPLNIKFSSDFNLDVFDMYGISANVLTMVCSNRARDLLLTEEVVGLNFQPLDEYLESLSEQAGAIPPPV